VIDLVSSHHVETRHRGSRPGDIRRLNRAAALKLLRDQPRGRAELARAMGLSKTALSDLIADLIAAGIVIEHPPTPTERGRHPAPLELNAQRFSVIGIDVAVDHFEAGLYDSLGCLLERVRMEVGIFDNNEAAFSALVALIRPLLQPGIGRGEITAIGVASPGPVDVRQGLILGSPKTTNFKGCHLAERLNLEFGIPTRLERDTTAAANAFLRTTAELEHFVYILLQQGIGAAIVIGHQVFLGQHGFAGEFGHVRVDLEGKACACGNRGCLETIAGSDAIEAHYKRLSGQFLEIHALSVLARNGDTQALAAFDAAGTALGQAAITLINLLDPRAIILGHPGPQWADLLLKNMRHELSEHAYAYLDWGSQIEIEISTLEHPVSHGAAEMVLEAIYRGEIPIPQWNLKTKEVLMT
jgi:predicted NBD/HSP70 family sugar kinase/biotin operon repressor